MANFFIKVSDRIRERFMNRDELSDQSIAFLERYYERLNPFLRKLAAGENGDIYLSSKILDSRFNTNIKARIGTFDEMSWGFRGLGSHSLALNILYHFTGDEAFAKKHAFAFREEFLLKIGLERSWFIPGFMVNNWINEQKSAGGFNVSRH